MLRLKSALIDQFAADASSSFVRDYVGFKDMSALRFAQSFARAIHSQKAHYLPRVSLEDRQVNAWRSERHFAFNDHNLQSFNHRLHVHAAADIVWENRF